MDRVGRMLIDLAPHIAMLGTVQSMSMISGLPSSLAALLQEGSFLSERLENRINHIIGRAQSTNNDISSGSQTENNSLSSQGRSLSFEIPVMLNPGEILSVLPRTSDWISDGHVHLHLNADVYIPGTYLNNPSIEYITSEFKVDFNTDSATGSSSSAPSDSPIPEPPIFRAGARNRRIK